MRRRHWLWIVLFASLAALFVAFATTWNVVLVQQYSQMSELAKELARGERRFDLKTPLIWSLVMGSLTVVAGLLGMIVFFVRWLREAKLNQLQKEFLARVSHELKSPVTSLDLTASLLRSGASSKVEEEKLWAIHDFELRRLKIEIDMMLEASRWEAQGFRPERRELDLEDWLQRSLPRWRQILGREGELTREGAPLASKPMLDERILDLVTNNIVDNARKFARLPGPRVSIRTEIAVDDKGRRVWRLSFEDQGWGFDPQAARKLFKRFYRAKAGGVHAIPGTGLGLFLARSAAKALRVRLRAESQGHGQGARFTLEGRV